MPARAAPPASAPPVVGVVAFDGISPFHLSVPCLVFGDDRSELGAPRFRFKVCAEHGRSARASAGFRIETAHGLAGLADCDLVIVPSWRDVSQQAPPKLIGALRRAYRRGATVVGLCLGAFVLAEAGLLDGRRATTHWAWADRFRERFPAVELDAEVLYVDEGRIVTSAGTAAGLDCCLHLLRRFCDGETVNRIARRLVVAPHRAGGQAQFIEQPVAVSRSDERLSGVLEWALRQLAKPLDIDCLAARAAMSRRSFTRHFHRVTGMTVTDWLVHQRLGCAARLLEGGRLSIETIAERAGFGSAASMRQHFQHRFGIAPREYRRQFMQRGHQRPPAAP